LLNNHPLNYYITGSVVLDRKQYNNNNRKLSINQVCLVCINQALTKALTKYALTINQALTK